MKAFRNLDEVLAVVGTLSILICVGSVITMIWVPKNIDVFFGKLTASSAIIFILCIILYKAGDRL